MTGQTQPSRSCSSAEVGEGHVGQCLAVAHLTRVLTLNFTREIRTCLIVFNASFQFFIQYFQDFSIYLPSLTPFFFREKIKILFSPMSLACPASYLGLASPDACLLLYESCLGRVSPLIYLQSNVTRRTPYRKCLLSSLILTLNIFPREMQFCDAGEPNAAP